MANLMPLPKMRFSDNNGNPLVGGKVFFFEAGTNTPKNTFTDSTGLTPNTNPVILDSRGEASIWLGSGYYKVQLKTSTDVVVWTQDKVSNLGDAQNVLFVQAGTGAIARTAQEKLREVMSVKDFGAVGDGVTNDTAAIQAALNAASGVARLVVPSGTYLVTASRNTMPFPWKGGIEVPSNTHMILDPNAIIQVAPNNLDKHYCFSLYAVQNVIIEGGKIIGDRSAHTYPNLFNTLADLTANNYRTKDNYDADPPVWADGKIAYVYLDSGANNGTYTRTAGVWVRTSASVPSYLTHEFGYGIAVQNSKDVWINRCQVSDFTGDSIFIGDVNQGPSPSPATNTSRVFVNNNKLFNSRRQGISVVDGDDILISNNYFLDIGTRINLQDGTAPRSGVDIESGTGSKSDRVTVANNVFKNCASNSVINYDGNSVTITGNVMDTAINYGFGVNTTITGNVVSGSGISGNGKRIPILFTYTQSGSTMTVTTASAHGLANGAEGYFEFLDANGFVVHFGLFTVSVSSTTVMTFGTPGFTSASGNGSYKYSVNNITITGNTVYGGNLNATGNKLVINNNALVNSAMFIFGDANDVMIANNSFKQSSISGAAGYTNVVINGNAFEDSISSYAITAFGTNTLISNNQITRCFGGIAANGGSGRISANLIDISAHPTPQNAIQTTGASTLFEVSENTIRNHNGSYGMTIQAPTLLINNRVLRWSGAGGIFVTGANSDGSSAIGNVIESNRPTTGTSIGLAVSNNTKFRAIGNVIYALDAALLRAIDTAGSTNSRITNNVHAGAINSNGSDTLTTNVVY